MSPKEIWAEKLRKYQRAKDENYARKILSPPQPIDLYKSLRMPGVTMIMGDIRSGKTGLAHEIAYLCHKKKNMPAVLHIPKTLNHARAKIQAMVPEWMAVTADRSKWPTGAVVIYDEAAQEAHSRRAQSGGALELDDLLSIAGQRQQLILFISHYSRKLDLNVCTAVHRIIWKRPTFAHQLWERNEISDFTAKAYDFFSGIKGEVAKKKACLVLDLDNFNFYQTKNRLPEYWTSDLSALFESNRARK